MQYTSGGGKEQLRSGNATLVAVCRRLTTGPPCRHWRDPQAGPAKRCKGPLRCDEPRKELPVDQALPAADWRLRCGTFNNAMPDSLMSPPLTSTLPQPLLPYQDPTLACRLSPLPLRVTQQTCVSPVFGPLDCLTVCEMVTGWPSGRGPTCCRSALNPRGDLLTMTSVWTGPQHVPGLSLLLIASPHRDMIMWYSAATGGPVTEATVQSRSRCRWRLIKKQQQSAQRDGMG